MKTYNRILILYRSNKFRNTLLAAGICLSVFLISSFRVGSDATIEFSTNESVMTLDQDVTAQSEVLAAQATSDQKSIKYHNFLTSYFLQESSFKRISKRSGEERELFSGVKNFHNIIISKALSLF